MRDYWNGAAGEYWARRATRFDEGVAGYREIFLATAGITPDADVLDVGCGSGETTRDAGRLGRSALGVDLSEPMLAVARERSAELPNVRYVRADAQTHEFDPVDVIISRTGVMFFDDPAAAFTNLASALRPGGRIAFMTWQPHDRNEWQQVLRRALSGGDPPEPGLFNDPDRMRSLLTEAGFGNVAVVGHETPMYFGPDIDDACAFLAGQHNASPAATARLRASMHDNGNGVWFDSAAWFVSAHVP